jgi:hypothetical protein
MTLAGQLLIISALVVCDVRVQALNLFLEIPLHLQTHAIKQRGYTHRP